MLRMSRAGRKKLIKRALMQHLARVGDTGMTAGQLARKIGMKSSTDLKKMCKEMAEVDEEIGFKMLPDGVWRVAFFPLKQVDFGERFFVINGTRRKVAEWVTDFRGVANV